MPNGNEISHLARRTAVFFEQNDRAYASDHSVGGPLTPTNRFPPACALGLLEDAPLPAPLGGSLWWQWHYNFCEAAFTAICALLSICHPPAQRFVELDNCNELITFDPRKFQFGWKELFPGFFAYGLEFPILACQALALK